MKGNHHVWLIAFIALITIALAPAPDAFSDDSTCSIKSDESKLFINVYNVNPDEKPEKLIWQGILKRNQQVSIKTDTGRFYYNYSTDPEATTAMISGMVRYCNNGEILILP